MEHAVLMSDSHTLYDDVHEMLVSDGDTESWWCTVMEHEMLVSDSHTESYDDVHEVLVSDGDTESYDDVQLWNEKC